MKKEELKKEIENIDLQIEALEKSKKELVDQLLFGGNLTKGEQIRNILDYGGHSDWLINYTPEGILEKYIRNYERHVVVELEGVIENIGYYYAPTFEEHLEVLKMFGIEEEFTQADFERIEGYQYSKKYPMIDFEKLWDDIVKAGVSSFTFDW